MKALLILTFFLQFSTSSSIAGEDKQLRVLVITGGHGYDQESFNEMLSKLGPEIKWEVAELPGAYTMFLPENRGKYDVLVFYHMFQEITTEQQQLMSDCIGAGKPVVALHHSICAYDNWQEYWRIIGGKYFHKETFFDGTTHGPCSYKHDVTVPVNIADENHPVTRGIMSFELLDETYKGYWVDKDVKVLLTTDEPTSTNVIGWTKMYGKAKIVVIQSGHDKATFSDNNYIRLLKQSINFVSE